MHEISLEFRYTVCYPQMNRCFLCFGCLLKRLLTLPTCHMPMHFHLQNTGEEETLGDRW